MELPIVRARFHQTEWQSMQKLYKKVFRYLMFNLPLIGLIACSVPPEMRTDHIPALPRLDLDRYQGVWYEIMRLPNSFEEGLEQVTATYTIQEDDNIKVVNRGFDPEKGKWDEADGKAWLPDTTKPAELKVSFFWIFSSAYKVIALDQENYTYAMVTSDSKKYLWILSRTPHMADETLKMLQDKAAYYGFEVDKLIKVKQS
jgi:apolipoprotein D and lipocalin family protein